MSAFADIYSMLPLTSYTVGSYWLTCARLKVITNEFKNVSQKIENGCDEQLQKEFCDIIDDISDTRQLSDYDFIVLSPKNLNVTKYFILKSSRTMTKYSDLQHYTITSTFLWSILSISSCMLATQYELVEWKSSLKDPIQYWFFLFYFQVGAYIDYIRFDSIGVSHILVTGDHVYHMHVRRKANHCIRRI